MATGETSWYGPLTALAHAFGWRVQHSRPAREQSGRWSTPIQGDKGWPDFVFSHPLKGLTLFREIKGPKTSIDPDQRLWLQSLKDSGLDVAVWRMPVDFEVAVRVLSFGAAYAVGSQWRSIAERGMFGTDPDLQPEPPAGG